MTSTTRHRACRGSPVRIPDRLAVEVLSDAVFGREDAQLGRARRTPEQRPEEMPWAGRAQTERPWHRVQWL